MSTRTGPGLTQADPRTTRVIEFLILTAEVSCYTMPGKDAHLLHTVPFFKGTSSVPKAQLNAITANYDVRQIIIYGV